MSEKLRTLLFVLSITLTLLVGVVGTYAYFVDEDSATNVFAVGKVKIELDEADVDDSTPMMNRDKANSYEMIPGETFVKDPLVTVKEGSHACWVFVEVIDNKVSYNGVKYQASDFLTYSINEGADGWTKLSGEENIYYVEVPQTTEDLPLPNVLIDNQVVVRTDITKEMLNNVAAAAIYPELSFKAYAFQKVKGDTNNDGVVEEFSVTEAWAQLQAE